MNKFKERYLIDGKHVDKSKVVLVPKEREDFFQTSDGKLYKRDINRSIRRVKCAK